MTKLPRIHCELPLVAGTELVLDGERHHYLAHVLRLAADSPLHLFNDTGEFRCRVLEIHRHFSCLLCERESESLPSSLLQVALYVSLCKSRSMDLALQKATELGVASIQPVLAARSVVSAKIWGRKLSHWRGITRSACEQCGRRDLPTVAAPVSLEEVAAPSDTLAFVLDPDSQRSLPAALRSLVGPRFAILVGPEGGLAEAEVLTVKGKGFVPVSLGPRLMRVETAAAAALSVLQAFRGDFAASGT